MEKSVSLLENLASIEARIWACMMDIENGGESITNQQFTYAELSDIVDEAQELMRKLKGGALD